MPDWGYWVGLGIALAGVIAQWIENHREKDRVARERATERAAEEERRRLEAAEIARWKENVILRLGQLEGFREDTREKHGALFELLRQIDRRLSHIEGALNVKPQGEDT